MQFLLFLLVFIAGSLCTIALEQLAVRFRAARHIREQRFRSRVIREYEAARGWPNQ